MISTCWFLSSGLVGKEFLRYIFTFPVSNLSFLALLLSTSKVNVPSIVSKRPRTSTILEHAADLSADLDPPPNGDGKPVRRCKI